MNTMTTSSFLAAVILLSGIASEFMTQGQALRVTLPDGRTNNAAVDLPLTPNRVLSPAQDRFLGATSTIASDSQLQTSVEAALGFTSQVVAPVVGKSGSVCVQFSMVIGAPGKGLTVHVSFAGTTTTKDINSFEVDYMFGVGATWNLGAIGLKAWSFSFEGHITLESSNPIPDRGCDDTLAKSRPRGCTLAESRSGDCKDDCLSDLMLLHMSAGEKSRHLIKEWIQIRFSNKKLTKTYAARGAKMVKNSKVIYDDMTNIDAEEKEHEACLEIVERHGAHAQAAATKSGCTDLLPGLLLNWQDQPGYYARKFARQCQKLCDQVLGRRCTEAERSSKFFSEKVAEELDQMGIKN